MNYLKHKMNKKKPKEKLYLDDLKKKIDEKIKAELEKKKLAESKTPVKRENKKTRHRNQQRKLGRKLMTLSVSEQSTKRKKEGKKKKDSNKLKIG